MRSERLLVATLLALALGNALLHGMAVGPGRDPLWGVNAYAFLPGAWLPVGLVMLAAGAALACRKRSAAVRAVPPAAAPAAWPTRRRVGTLALASAAGFVLSWLARARHIILGDGSTLVVSIAQGERFHPRQPLAAALQHLFYRCGGAPFGAGRRPAPDVAWDTAALGSAVAGALFVPVAWALAGELAALRRRDPAEGTASDRTANEGGLALVICLLLLTQGYAQLFCGYVENYTWYTLALATYLWLALRAMRTGTGLLGSATVLLVAVLLHLSGAIVAPAFAVVALGAVRRRESRRTAVRDLLAAGALAIAAMAALSHWGGGYGLLATLAEVARAAVTGTDAGASGYHLSAAHLRDFANEQLLIGPLGLPLFLAAAGAVLATRAAGRPAALFLLLAGGAYLGASWLAGESNLGYPRNWDLLAPGGLVFTAGGLGLFLVAGVPARRAAALLWCAVALSLFHTVPWVAVNASFDRSFARLKTLPSENGITQANVGRWCLLRGERAEARAWIQRALAVNPNNNNAHWILGRMAMEDGDYDAAARAFGRAVALRPDKEGYRESLTEALLSAGRWTDAVREARPLVEATPDRGRLWGLYGMALAGAARPGEAAEAFARCRAVAPDDTATARVIARFHLQRAEAACGEKRWHDALSAYHEALRWDERNAAACLNLGLVLRACGRAAEARPWLERALQLAPDLPDAPRVRALLQAGPP